MTAPKISFVIINHNYGQYVGQAISSVLSQDYAELECIVLDNASTDDSRDIIARFENTDPRLAFEYLDDNLHQMGAFLHVLDRLAGELVCIVDADDFLFANFAAFHAQLHCDCPTIGATSGGVLETDHAGRPLSSGFAWLLHRRVGSPLDPDRSHSDHMILGRRERELLGQQSTVIEPHEAGWHWSPGTANVYKRHYLVRCKPSLAVVGNAATDNYFMPFVHALAGSACIDLPLSAYRIHGGNVHGAQPSLPNLRTFSKAAHQRSRVRRSAMVRELASHARDFVSTHGHAFWTLMDAPSVPDGISLKAYFNDPAIQDILADHFDEILAACGEAETREALRARMGRKGYKQFLALQGQRKSRPDSRADGG
ncbi:glycosyltransferase [Mesorhizobium sp. ESP-6-4]|uniref:glycosyltransferase family 2 protein n=1 Tax=Mesorhizobium sp. ESP-6-4 TaxID=2876624 RepID=UPI001CCE5CC9|nr:glycosyltransferase family 2 protein [Mesorhizobium sp. ESP-6-4]MBZ9658724.1 glycosyltransferase [Mesorhizobium sp. ESP-6-4]